MNTLTARIILQNTYGQHDAPERAASHDSWTWRHLQEQSKHGLRVAGHAKSDERTSTWWFEVKAGMCVLRVQSGTRALKHGR